MKLSEIRSYIGNILDYQPDITTYKNQLDAVINEQYMRLFTEKPFTFAQKEAVITARKDDELTAIAVANGAATLTDTATANQFESYMEGQVIDLDGTEYTIAWVATANLAYLTNNYEGSSATLATVTVKHRYLDLPQDCVEIMQVLKRAMTLTPQEPGRMIPLTRYEDEFWNLPLNEVNLPNYWVPYDDYSLIPPKAPSISAQTSGSGRGVRTLEFAVSYVFAGRESALSPTTSIKLTDVQYPAITLAALPNTTGFYRKVYVRCVEAGINKFYNIPEATSGTSLYSFLPTSAGAFGYTAATSLTDFNDAFELTYSRYDGVDGNLQRIRMYPRQSQNYSITVRYMYRPIELIDAADTPEFPSASHQILAYMALRDIFVKHDNDAQAAMYDRKVVQEMLKIEQRYLNSIAKRYIKRFMAGGRTDPVPMYTPLSTS
jgi:hypothetical protein|tara:strand:- start:11 stop:1309 length:1299 start_codon:yes stop_codon:yes gene_type:complete